MTKEDLERLHEMLFVQKTQILVHAQQVQDGEIHVDADDRPDEIDSAVSESSLSFTGQMREREFGLLKKIEQSLEKIEQGTYGECESCGEEIALGRLRARPMAEFCIACKEEEERLARQAD